MTQTVSGGQRAEGGGRRGVRSHEYFLSRNISFNRIEEEPFICSNQN